MKRDTAAAGVTGVDLNDNEKHNTHCACCINIIYIYVDTAADVIAKIDLQIFSFISLLTLQFLD